MRGFEMDIVRLRSFEKFSTKKMKRRRQGRASYACMQKGYLERVIGTTARQFLEMRMLYAQTETAAR
jgi:hypothetical protein